MATAPGAGGRTGNLAKPLAEVCLIREPARERYLAQTFRAAQDQRSRTLIAEPRSPFAKRLRLLKLEHRTM